MIFKSYNQHIIRPLVYLTLAVLGCTLLTVLYCIYEFDFHLREVPTKERMEVTPLQIKTVKDVRIWEFLSIDDEELVTRTKKNLLKDAQLTRIYYGKVRFGIDLDKASPDWVQMVGDTVDVTLPRLQLLDHVYVDEARTETFYETGSWSNEEKEALYAEAQQQMKKRCVTNENVQIAQRNAIQQFEKIFMAMGFMYVNVHF